MNIINNSCEQSFTFTIENGARTYNERTCPPGVRPVVEKAVERGQTSGSLAAAGRIWRWARTPFSAETIAIEFTQRGEVVESYKVPKIAWQAFQLVAAKNGFEAEDFLVVALAGCVTEGMNILEALRWLMPDETAEMLEAHYAELA